MVLVVGEQLERRDVAAADPRERLLPSQRGPGLEPRDGRLAEAGRGELPPELRLTREPFAVDPLDRGEDPAEPELAEASRVEGRDADAPALAEDTSHLAERTRPIDEVDRQ